MPVPICVENDGEDGGGGENDLTFLINSETKKPKSHPWISFVEPEITLRSTLEEEERRSGGKAVEERAPPPRGMGDSVLPEFGFRMLGKRARATSPSGVMGNIRVRLLRKKRHPRFFVHFSTICGRAPSESGQLVNPQHGLRDRRSTRLKF